MAFLKILNNDILQLNFHTLIGSWAQFEELHGPFVNLGSIYPQNIILPIYYLNQTSFWAW